MGQTIGIKDMRAFFAIVEEGNISHAAQRLGIAQPALSRQMKHLEENLHVKLFERGSRRIRLTEAGALLYGRVENILGMVDGTVREIKHSYWHDNHFWRDDSARFNQRIPQALSRSDV